MIRSPRRAFAGPAARRGRPRPRTIATARPRPSHFRGASLAKRGNLLAGAGNRRVNMISLAFVRPTRVRDPGCDVFIPDREPIPCPSASLAPTAAPAATPTKTSAARRCPAASARPSSAFPPRPRPTPTTSTSRGVEAVEEVESRGGHARQEEAPKPSRRTRRSPRQEEAGPRTTPFRGPRRRRPRRPSPGSAATTTTRKRKTSRPRGKKGKKHKGTLPGGDCRHRGGADRGDRRRPRHRRLLHVQGGQGPTRQQHPVPPGGPPAADQWAWADAGGPAIPNRAARRSPQPGRRHTAPRGERSRQAQGSPEGDPRPGDPGQQHPQISRNTIYNYVLKSTAWIITKHLEGGAMGTGSLIDRDNRLVLTNYHVVHGMVDFVVFFPVYDKETSSSRSETSTWRRPSARTPSRARWWPTTRSRDLALIQLDRVPEGVEPLPFCQGRPGQGRQRPLDRQPRRQRLAVGLHARRRSARCTRRSGKPAAADFLLDLNARVVETDSPTNPGDSGGPCVNDRGELVGVTQGGFAGRQRHRHFHRLLRG